MTLALLCAALAAGPLAPNQADPAQLLRELLRGNARPISLEGEPSGPGLEWLVQQAGSSRFVRFGEDHNLLQIPPLTSALFRRLHGQFGFQHLALEQASDLTETLANPKLAGNLEELRRFARHAPNAITFATDQELELIAAAQRLSSATPRAVWCLDQVFGTAHVLDELARLAPNEPTRVRVERLAAHARPDDALRFTSGRHYLAAVEKPVGFTELPDWYRAAPGSRAAFLIEQLTASNRIYANWRHGAEEPTRYASNFEREELMKELFANELRRAQAAGEAEPKVLLKFGHHHLRRGLSHTNVFTLGTFVAEVAKLLGGASFGIAAYSNNAEAGVRTPLTQIPTLAPFADAIGAGRSAVIDLRPLRAELHRKRIVAPTPDFHELVFGYEAVVLIGGAAQGTYRALATWPASPAGAKE